MDRPVQNRAGFRTARADFVAADLDGSERRDLARRDPHPGLDPDVMHPGEDDERHPAGGRGSPEAIAASAVYLASDDAAFVHGTVIDVDGGRMGAAVIAT
jgi:NAD(P)-dependent dehydrogenase (short-subunit alcohol dehydrogenase family)